MPRYYHFDLIFSFDFEICEIELISCGRKIMIVGDINSLHKPIDSCDPKKMLRRYEKENFNEIPHIKWYFCFLLLFKLDTDINSNCNRFDQFLVDGGGNFIDLFRHFYPERTQGELFFDLNSILPFIFTYIIFF